MNCPLCSTPSQLYHTHTERDDQQYFRCPECQSIAMHPRHYLTPDEEKARYLTHNNDVNDPGYQKFVRPVIQAVTTRTQINHHGLDYGAGTGPGHHQTSSRKRVLHDHLRSYFHSKLRGSKRHL